MSGPKAAGSKTRRCGKKKSGRGKKKSAKPKPLSNVRMKPSISRLVKARTSAKMAASALDKGTGGHATEDTIGKMLAHSRKEPVIDLVYSSRENPSSDEDEASICLIKPSPKLTSAWWQYYRVYNPVLRPEMKHIAVCNVRGCNHPSNEDNEDQDNGTKVRIKTSCIIHGACSNISKALVNYAKGEIPKSLALQMTRRTPNWPKMI